MEQRGLYVVCSTKNVPYTPMKVSRMSSIPIHLTIIGLYNVMRGNNILEDQAWRVFDLTRIGVRIKEVGFEDSMCDTTTNPGPQRPNSWFT